MTKLDTSLCPKCNGEGYTKEYLNYSHIMPDKEVVRCDICNGLGEILHLPQGLQVYRDSSNPELISNKFNGI